MGDFPFQSVQSPLLITGAVQDWPALKWTPQHMASILKDKKFRCKILERGYDKIVPETECLHMMCSLKQYCDWLDGCCEKGNPLKSLPRDKYSVYVDYKHMKDMFVECPELLQEVSWGSFGFPDRNGAESSIWIGSTGAYTPCHQDTYGFNLVTQIYGSKRWILFPPSQTECMYPTRIPYEESSIFCEVNILKPNFHTHKKFKEVTPYIVDLHQGDALYVPRHWWHFVQCTESSISVNTWLPMEEDKCSHISEAVTKFLMTSVVSSLQDRDMDKIVNPNEELESPEKCLKYIEVAVKGYRENYEKVRPRRCLDSELNSGIAIERQRSVDNLTKFSHKFKDFKVKKLRSFHPSTSAESLVSALNYSESPGRKKMKLSEDSSDTNSLNYGCTSVEVYEIRKYVLDEYLILFNIEPYNTENKSPESQQDSNSKEQVNFWNQEGETVTESFCNKVLKAVFEPSIIAKMSENIVSEIT